jgi:hypothetical protein
MLPRPVVTSTRRDNERKFEQFCHDNQEDLDWALQQVARFLKSIEMPSGVAMNVDWDELVPNIMRYIFKTS